MTRAQKTGLFILALAALAASTVVAQALGLLAREPRHDEQPVQREPNLVRYAPGSAQLASIKVISAQEYPVPLAEPLSGRVTYDENVTARVSSPIAGRVIGIAAQPGDTVRVGASLATLDSPDLAAAIADLDKARADGRRKTVALERARTLLEGGVLARKDFESAETDALQAQAESERAERRLANLVPGAHAAREYALRTPVSGVVVDRQVNPGMEVRPDLSSPLFVITDPTRLWVLVDLPERNLSKVAPDRPVSVEVDAWPDERFPGRIVKVAEVVDPATRRIQVRCVVPNPERKLKPEMFARVLLLSDQNRRAVRVPNSALVTEGLFSYVFFEKGPGAFEKRRVRLEVQDRDYAYVSEGLSTGGRVVVQGALLLNSELRSAG